MPPAVALRHPANDDCHEESPSSSSDQRAQKLNSQGDGKTSVTTVHKKCLWRGAGCLKVGTLYKYSHATLNNTI